MKGVIMQVMHRLIRLLVKVFADVFAFIPGMVFMTAVFVRLVYIQPLQALAADCYSCAHWAILTDCTAFDPANRYGKINEFLKAILMRRLVTILLVIVFMVPSFVAFAQDQSCSKPKISVNADAITEEIYDFFQSQYAADTEHDNMLPGFDTWQTEEVWRIRIHDHILQILQEYNPYVEFISNDPENGDYQFTYSIYLIAIDEILPETGNSFSKTGYNIRSKFTSSDACGVDAWVLKDKMSSNLDLFQAIRNLVGFHFYDINRITYYHEKKYPTPVRGPRIEAHKTRNSLSPLLNERKSDLQIKVYNCKNELGYDIKGNQYVFVPRETARGEFNPTHGQQLIFTFPNYLKLGIQTPEGASATYELKKGTQPGIEKVEIYTCGRDRKETKTIELNIDGLEIQVKPKQSTIFSDEKTSIDIYFNRISPNGKKRPIADKQLNLSVKGIVDGSISESKKVTTDSSGKATIEYKAGKKDELITIAASYHPKDYPDVVTGSSRINVISKEYEWKGSLNLEGIQRFQCNAEEQTSELGRYEVRANDEITRKVNLTISMDDFDLALNPAIPATHLIVDASGEMNSVYNEDHFTAVRAVKTWCFSKKWISPGSWNTRHKTWSSQVDRQIKKENINLLITKDMELNKEAMQDLQKQMQEAAQNNDMAAIQKLKGQMVGMVQGNQDNNTIPIRIRIEIVFDLTEKDTITSTYERKVYDVCLGRYEVDESGTNTIELPMAEPVVAELKGTYIRGKDGRDIITANSNKTETLQSDFYKEICPDVIITINGQINLERLRK